MQNSVQPKFGDIFYADLVGGENIQGGIRPVVIAQNDVGNKHSPIVEVIPMSSRIRKAAYMPTHVIVHANQMNGLRRDSVVLAEQPVTINKNQLLNKVGILDTQSLILIGQARRIQSPFPANSG